MNLFAAALGGFVVVCSLWLADHSYQVKEQAMQANADFAEQNAALLSHVNELAVALRDQAAVRTVLSDMSRRLNQTQSTLAGQTAQLNRSLAELKRTDEQITAYLAAPIPGALGVRYARAETTDPIEYRGAAIGVRIDPVPSAGSPGAGRQ
jgi:ABC-type transporter Mla subunit MlaD